MAQIRQGELVSKGTEGPMGRDELDRGALSELERKKQILRQMSPARATNGMDTNTLTGAGDRALDRANYPTGRETAADDFDQSVDPQVIHNQNRPVVGVHKAKRASGKKESMYARPIDEQDPDRPVVDVEGNNQQVNDAGHLEEDYDRSLTEHDSLTMEKSIMSNDATPPIDADSAPQTVIDETPNDPRDYLEHVDPSITQTSHVTRASLPDGSGMEWADWPSGVTER